MVKSAVVLSASFYVPETIIYNQWFVDHNPYFTYDACGNRIKVDDGSGNLVEKSVNTSDEKIVELMGVRQRRKASELQGVHDLAIEASRSCLGRSDVSPEDLEGIIVATVTNPMRFPSVACRVQEALKAANAKVCFDIAAACAGFPVALHIAAQHVLAGSGPYIVVGAEALSKIVDYTDMNAPLFGDGAGAMLLGPSDNEWQGVKAFASESNPFDGRAMWICQDPKGILRMPEGGKVLKGAVRGMYEVTRKIKEELGWSTQEVGLYIPHQANARIIEGFRKQLDIPPERLASNIDRYGNMSSATNPVAFAEAYQTGRIHAGSKVVLVALGSGLVTSGVGLVV